MKMIEDQNGNSLIEVAVFLPILITLLIGMLDCGFLLQQYMTVVDSVRTGAEVAMIRNYAAINSTNAAYLAEVAINSSLNISNYSVTVSNYCTCGPSSTAGATVSCSSYSGCPAYGIPAQYVKLVATASLPVLFSFSGFPATLNVQSTSIVRTAWTGTQ